MVSANVSIHLFIFIEIKRNGIEISRIIIACSRTYQILSKLICLHMSIIIVIFYDHRDECSNDCAPLFCGTYLQYLALSIVVTTTSSIIFFFTIAYIYARYSKRDAIYDVCAMCAVKRRVSERNEKKT
jgi:hypothetical protein